MTHTVKSGETLSKIAQAHNISLGQLLEANPRFKANPNRIRVGDVLNIPDTQAAPQQPQPQPPAPQQPQAPQTPQTPPPPVQPQPPSTAPLGKLSEKYETGGRGAGTVSGGQGDPGGVSYGSYQMTSKPNGGTARVFVTQPDFPFGSKFAGLTPGTPQFSNVWKQLAASNPDEFQNAQHDFIKRTHFDPLVAKVLREDGLNVLTRSRALQDVFWSTSVQHGPNSSIPHLALAAIGGPAPDDPNFDRKFITAIYNERGRKRADGVLAHFTRASPAVQKGVSNRFTNELKDALAMLAKEQGGQ